MTQRIYLVNDSNIKSRTMVRMLFLLLMVAAVLVSAGPASAGGGTIGWSTRSAQLKDQVPVASVTDTDGNVYVTGWSMNEGTDSDWWTTRFNANGSIAWHAVYNPSTGTDQAAAIALDSQNNVVVTGIASIGSSRGIHTIKYRGDTGAPIWERSFNGSSQDMATAVTVDNLDNVYVTGYTRNAQGIKHFVVIKYSHSDDPEQDGVQLWKAVHDQESANTEEAWSIAADGNGVAVTGFSGPGSDFDMLTVYYSADGVFMWEQRHNSAAAPPTGDQGKHVRLDQIGNVIATGYIVNSPGNTIYTAKYNRADGALIWEGSYPSIHDNEPTALTVDGAGNVYVAATVWTESGNNDFYVVKYGREPSTGTTAAKIWDSTFDSGTGEVDVASPTGIVVDRTSGDVYVTGYTESGGITGFQTVRYKGDSGAELWHAGYENPAGLNDRPVGIGLSPDGDVLVAGWTETPANGLDFLVVKYQAGGLNRPTGLIAQASSATSVSLSWDANSTNHTGFNIYRQDSLNGIWTRIATASGSPYTDSVGVAADTRYDYHVTAVITSAVDGSLLDESHPSDQAFAVTTIITPTVPAGFTTVDSPDHFEEAATSISVGPDNNPVVTGSTMLDIGGYDYLTIKYNAADLQPLWKDVYGDDTNGTDEARVVAVDKAGNIIVSGYSELDNGTTGNSSQIFTLKYNGAGNGDGTTSRLWNAQFKGTPRIDDRAEAVATAVDGSNNVVVGGRGRNEAGNYDLYVVKYGPEPNVDAFGNNIPPASWQAQPFDRGGDDQPAAVAFDAAGNIFVTGFTERRDAGSATAGSATTLTDAAKTWGTDQWRYAKVTITSGLNAGETRRITGHTATELTVDTPFSFPVGAGVSYDISDYDWFTAKYDGTTGARVWTDIYNSGFGNDRAYSVAVDPLSGDLYVTGYRSNAAGDTDIHTIKYKGSPAVPPSAEKLWSDGGRSFDGTGHGEDYAVSVQVTPLTQRVVVGGSTLSATGDRDYALFMYEPDGTPVWAPAARVPLKPESDDYAVAMAVDNSENIFLTGTIVKSDSTSDSMTLKYGADGVLLGTTVFDGAAHLNDESAAIAASSRGDVFVAGSSQAGLTNTDLLLYKINADVLQAPYPFTAAATYRSVTLSWPDNSTGEKYTLQRALGACAGAGGWTDLDTLQENTTSYTDNGLNVGTAYCYRIQAYIGTKGTQGYRESLWIKGDAVTLTPGAPGTLTVTPVNTTQVNLGWTLPALDGYTGFVIERCTGGSCTFTDAEAKVVFPPVSAQTTSFTDSSVCAGITYRYRITTVNRGLSVDNNGGWTLRKPVTFSNFRPNTYTQVTITYAAPMKADFSDVRFYDAVGQQELPYWIERKTDGVSAVIAVKTGVTDNAYLYYGNSAAQPVGKMTGLVAYWPFEETAGTISGTIADKSGNSFTGSLLYFNLPNGIIAGGKFGNALSLDGSSDHIRVADTTNSLLDITGSFTLEAWYQYAASGDWARIISKPTVGSNAPYHMYALLLDNTAGAQKPYIEFGGGTGSPKGPNLVPGNWYHLVGRYNYEAGRASIFVNGVEYGQNVTPVTIGVTDTNLGIGAEGLYGWSPTKGILDEVRIYNRSLTDQEIINRYGVVASAITLGAAEPPPNGAPSFDFSPLSWQSAYVNGATAAVMPAAPAPTLGSVSRISEARLDLSWTDNSSDETGFQIERMCTAGTGCADTDYSVVPGGNLGAYVGTGTKSFSDTGLKPNWTYSYRIRALKSGVCGWDNVLSVVKSASTMVNAPVVTSTTQVNTTRLDLAWTDDAATLSGYRVERCQGSATTCATGTFSPVGGTPAKTYDDIAACENTDYTYRVAALFNGLSASGGPWSMRTPVTIADFQPNFKTRLTIVYDSAMNADFSDIRFFDATAGRELPYWIESKTNGVSAVVWVKTGDNNAIYLYYGNRKATTSSNMGAVFGSGLVGFWQFEEAAGTISGTTADISGKGNHPTLSSISVPYGVVAGGVYGNALSLDGGAMNARMNPVTLPTGSVMSIEAWIKPTGYNTTTYNGIVSWGARSGANALNLCVQNNGRPSMATWGNDFVAATGAAATTNAWNHIAVVMNGTAVTLYMNGQPVSTTLGIVPNVTSQNFIIGSTDWTSGRSFKGLIDDVRVYDRVLTPQEIASSYAATTPTATADFAAAEAAPALPAEWLGPYSAITAQTSKKTAAAAPPTGLAVSWKSDSQLDLVWSDTNSDETGFKIERCADEACCRDALCTDPARKTVITVNGTGTTYTDGSLTPGATYWYRVRAFKTATCGWDKGGYGANDVKSGTTTVKAPENITVTPSLFTNCNDIRFADAAGTTVYPHWLQRSCNAADSQLTSRIPSLPVGDSPIYLYYGNLTAAGASSAAAVSEVFDDFQNLSAWTTAGAVTTDGNILTVNGSTAATASLYRNFSVAGTFVAEMKYQHPTAARNRLFLTTAAATASPTVDYGAFESLYWGGFTGTTLTANTWYIMRWENNASNYTWRILNQNGTEFFSRSTTPAIAGLQRMYLSGGESDNSDFKIDWLSVRKTATPSPVTLLDPTRNEFPASPYTVDGLAFLARKQLTATNSTGSVLTSFPVDMAIDTRPLATDRITINWNDPSAIETGFSIIRCTAADLVSSCDPETSGTWSVTAPLNSGATASYTDTSIGIAARYCYKIKALVDGVTTAFNATPVCGNTPVPTKPSGLVAAVTGTRVDLTWADTSPVLPAGYVVERCKIVTGSTCDFDVSDATFTVFGLDHSRKTFTDPDACGGTYRYRVKSVKPWISGWPTAYDGPVEASIGVPTPPSGLNAQAVTESQITLSWTDNTTDETSIVVQRCSLATCTDTDFATVSNGTLPANPGTGAMTFVDNTVTPNLTYTYRILVTKEGTCSWTVVSAELSDPAKTRAVRITPALTATPVNSTRIDLSWTDTTGGETGYRVIRCTDAACTSSTTVATLGVGTPSYSDTAVCNSTQPYYYQVAGFKSAALSFAGGGAWTKRAKLAITGFQQNFQTKVVITVANFSGMDATLKDVRFYDATAGGELPYWIEKIDSGVATVYVRTGNNNDIYLYYGNASATAASSGAATFLLFEDFESGMGRLGTGKAVQITTPVKSGSFAGSLSSEGALVEDYVDLGSMIKGRITIDYNLPQTNMDVVAATLTTSGWGSDQGWILFKSNGYAYFRSAASDYYLYSYGSNAWNKIDLNFDTTTDTYSACINDGCSIARPFVAASNDVRYLRLAQPDTAGETIYFDNLRVGAYAATQPTTSLGTPESSAAYSFTSSWSDDNRSAIVPATTPALAIPALTGVTKASDNRINLAWTDSNSDESGFMIDRCADSECATVIRSVKSAAPASTAGNYADTGLAPGTAYYYRLRAYKPQPGACGGDVLGAWSGISGDTTDSPVPTNLTATTYGSNTVNLAWNDTTQGDTGFAVERCDGDPCTGPFTQVGATVSNPDPYVVRYTFNNSLQDSSGSGLHLTGTAPVYEEGGLRLSTSTSYQSPMTSILDTDYYTIEFDFKMLGVTPTANSWHQVFAYRPPNTDRSPAFWLESGSRAMFTWQHDNITYSGLSGLGPNSCNSTSQFALGSWYHIKGVKNGSSFKIYINGSTTPVCEAVVANPKVPGSSPLYFGGAEIVLRNFTITNDTVTKRMFTDSTACSGMTYTYQVKAVGGGLSSGGSDCWKRRAKVSFGTNGFIANHQTRLTINRSTYADIQSDFRDIRFYDSVAEVEIPYWIEKVSGSTATVWIKTGNNDSVYLYYGNASASSAANGAAVFEIFDDFDGTTLNPNTWRIVDSTGFSVSNGRLYGTDTTGKLESIVTFGTGTVIEAKASSTKSAIHGQLIAGASWEYSSWTKGSIEWRNKNNALLFMNGYNASTGVVPGASSVLYRLKLKTLSSVDGETVNYDTGAALSSFTVAPMWTSSSPFVLALGRALYSDDRQGEPRESYATDWDWVLVRKYVATEPTVTLGAVEGDGIACQSINTAWPLQTNLVSNQAQVTMPLPVAPAGLSATVSGAQATLSWVDTTADETGFTVERCTSGTASACEFSSLDSGFPKTAPTNSTAFTDPGLSYQTTYCYRMRSYRTESCGAGQWQSPYSDSVCTRTAAAPPFNLKAEAQNSFKVNLTWEYDTSEGEAGFEVERLMPNGSWTQVGRTAANVTSFTDVAGIEPGKGYRYRVRAVYGSAGSIQPTAWTQRALIRNAAGAVVPGEDITGELSGAAIEIVDTTNGSALIIASNGTVEMSTSSTGGGSSTATSTSRVLLKNLVPYAGDFDVQVDYSMPDGQLTGGEWIVHSRLHAAFGSNSATILRVMNSGKNQYYASISMNGVSSTAFIPTADTAGKLRIKRQGDVTTLYVWSGGTWIAVHTGSCSSQPATSLQLLQEVRRKDTAAVRTIFSNFVSSPYTSPYSNEATVTFTSGGTTIPTTPPFVPGATPCD